MKKPITILTILVMLLSLSVIFSSCGNKCEHTYDNACDVTCNECGEERTITHTPSADDGDCTTPITCSVCKTVTTPAKDSHTGGTATCTEKAVCTVCGTAYGTVDGDNHIDENTDHICDRECGKTDIGIHADSAEDNDHACDYGCGATLEDHKGGTATCVSGNLCEICGVEYDTTKNPNNHTSTEFTYTENNDGTHNKLYACCEAVHTANEACSGGTATCVSGKICDFCETTYGDVDSANHASENYTYTDNGDGTHTKTHECGVVVGEPENHTLTYTANINIITESCSVGCGYSETATISAKDATYDGLEHNTAIVNYSEGWKGGELTISYVNNTNAGTATASITVGEATATVDFTIAKAPLTVTADAKIKSYGDENPTLTYTAEGLLGGDTLSGALTGALSREEGENVGLYAITLGTLSADNYTISYEGADFTIQAKEVTDPTVTLDRDSYVYDGTAKEPKVISIVVDGRTLTEGTDYTIRYENNVYVGNYATVVINFEGNYDGTFHRWFAITQDPKTTEFYGECIGNGKLPDIHTSQNTDSSTDYHLSLPLHIYQSVPETETPAVEFVAQQLDIGGGISMKFYVRNNEDRPLESIFIEVEFVGKLTYLTECEKHPTEAKVYIYTLEGITPQCLGDSMNVIILVGGIPLWHENTVLMDYSVEKNLLEIRKTADALTVQLIDDLLAYGKAASEYKKHDTMTGDYTVSDSTIPDATVTPNGAFTGYTVVFGQVNFIKVSVELADGYTLYLDGTDITTQLVDGIFKTDGIAPTEFDKKFSFEIKNGDTSVQTFAVSVIDYIGAQKDSAAMGNLVKALYNYGVSAELYNHVKTGVGEHTFDSAVNNGDTHTKACACGESITEGHSYDGNGECICGAKAAIISTLDDLKAAIENGGEYMLGDNIHVPESLKVETEIILQLNGKNITGDGEIFWVNTGGALTILGDGVLSTNTNDYIIFVSGLNNPSVNIAGGTIEGEIYVSMGTCEISGGQIEKLDATSRNAICEISGGRIEMLNRGEGACTVSGGYINTWYSGVGAFTIIGGTFGVDPTAYVDTETHTVTNNGDGTWTVTAK